MAASKWTAEQIPSQAGKLSLVTGANSGIGYQTALQLARHGAHVLLGCRNLAKGQAALDRLRREAPGASAEVVELDMASLASIRRFAAHFATQFAARGATYGTGLDLLVNNAGVMALPHRELTADGFERQFGTNHLGHFALVGRLLPQLLAAPGARVVSVSSLAAWLAAPVLSDLAYERAYDPWRAYARSKRANLLYACELDRRARAAGTDLRSVAAHPGWAATDLVANGPARFSSGAGRAVYRATGLGAQAVGLAARPQLRAATDPAVSGGAYFGPRWWVRGAPVTTPMPPGARDPAAGAALWAASEAMTGVVYDFGAGDRARDGA